MTTRRRRGARVAPKVRLRFGPNDRSNLLFIGRSGVADLPAIAFWGWGASASDLVAAARRTRQYVDAGLVVCTAPEPNRPNRYALTTRGAERVGRVDAPILLRLRLTPTSNAAEHLAAVSRVTAAFARAHVGGPARIAELHTEGELRRRVGRREGALVPDALVRVDAPAGSMSFAIEVDLGGESLGTWSSKFRRYLPVLRGDGEGRRIDLLLVFAPGRGRLASIARVATKTGVAHATAFGDLETMSPSTVTTRLATAMTFANDNPFTARLALDARPAAPARGVS